MSEKDGFISEEEAKLLLEQPHKVKKNRSSLIIGSSAHQEAMMATRSKVEISRFKLKSFD
jgi:hypothetical protein